MPATAISSHVLDNGLTLHFTDESRKIASDRWYIRVWVTLDIPVVKRWFADGSMDDERFARIAGVVGETVVFKQKKERNFISEEAKDQVIQDICRRTWETNRAYLGSEAFAAKFILKTYAERQQRPLP